LGDQKNYLNFTDGQFDVYVKHDEENPSTPGGEREERSREMNETRGFFSFSFVLLAGMPYILKVG
jgi:hypothetical protein